MDRSLLDGKPSAASSKTKLPKFTILQTNEVSNFKVLFGFVSFFQFAALTFIIKDSQAALIYLLEP